MVLLASMAACSSQKSGTDAENPSATSAIRLITLDPGHFHAYLVQKTMYDNVDSVVHVFAPEGPEVKEHLKKIEAYNNRAEAAS